MQMGLRSFGFFGIGMGLIEPLVKERNPTSQKRFWGIRCIWGSGP